MLEKNKINKEIAFLEKEILFLEEKRARSQASIMNAVVTHTPPEEVDLHFFRMYTAEIEVKRERLRELNAKLATPEE